MSASPPTSRVISVLEIVARNPDGINAAEIGRQLKLSRSTLSLILNTLVEMEYVDKLPDRSLRLGFGVTRLLNGLRQRFPLFGVADDELNRLHATFRIGCTLARVSSEHQEVIVAIGATEHLGITPGVRVPLQPPNGIISMAWQSGASVDKWLDTSPVSSGDELRERHRQAMSWVRELGFAVYGIQESAEATIAQLRAILTAAQSHDTADSLRVALERLAMVVGSRIYSVEELEARRYRQISHIIAPVFGGDAQPRYLISLHVMSDSVSPDDLEWYTKELRKSATSIMRQIGGKMPVSLSQPKGETEAVNECN